MKREQDVPGIVQRRIRSQSGFALIVALLTLLLLTFLGLTLATTTSTELQIATNYRWGQQAFYNAEAGLEVAKRYLREQTAWSIFLPVARPSPISGKPTLTWTAAGRDFENFDCDDAGTGETGDFQGYGVVLNLPSFGRFENVSAVQNQTLAGSFTLWIRRKVMANDDGTVQDYDKDDQLVLTSEGTAPFVGAAAATDFAFRRRAVRVLEAELSKIDPNDCENRGGQAGNSPTGSGYDPCYAVNAGGLPTGTGAVATEVNTGQ